MPPNDRQALCAKVLRYYEQADSGRFPRELFVEDFEFYSPKFGVGHGEAMFVDYVTHAGVKSIVHHQQTMLLLVDRNHVLAEGTTEGVTTDGVAWHGGQTPAGRFASVFRFDEAGLIERMYIYVDPDFASADGAGFRWDRGAAQAW